MPAKVKTFQQWYSADDSYGLKSSCDTAGISFILPKWPGCEEGFSQLSEIRLGEELQIGFTGRSTGKLGEQPGEVHTELTHIRIVRSFLTHFSNEILFAVQHWRQRCVSLFTYQTTGSKKLLWQGALSTTVEFEFRFCRNEKKLNHHF